MSSLQQPPTFFPSKPVQVFIQSSSAIPGLTIPAAFDKQILPAISLPRNNLNMSLPQNYHTYKSQSESPFQPRNKHSVHKSLVGMNQIILDKIDETTSSANLSKLKQIAPRQNRSISPRISEKEQVKNTLNPQNQRGNITRPSKNSGGSTPLRNPPHLNNQRLKLQTQEFKPQDKPFIVVQSQGLSSTLKSNSSASSGTALPLQPLAAIPEQQKPLQFQNQRLQGSQVTLVPKILHPTGNQVQLQSANNEGKQAAKKLTSTNIGSPVAGTQEQNSNNNNGPFKFYIGGGNNSERIRKLLAKREGWVEAKDPNINFVHFKWQQTNRGYKYEKLVEGSQYKQVVNHFEYHKEISNKQYLIKNLMSFAESIKQNVFDITPLTYVIDFNDDNCDLILNNFLKFFEMNMPPYLKKKQTNLQAKGNDIRKILRSFQTQNGQSGNEKLFNYFYTRWALQDTFLDQENSSYMWLLKPTFMNRGRGIHVFNSLQSLEKCISEYTEGFEEKSLKKAEEKPVEEINNNEQNIINLSGKKQGITSSQSFLPGGQQEEVLSLIKQSFSMQKLQEEEEKQGEGDSVSDNISQQQQQQKDKENQVLPSHQSVGSPDVKKVSQNGNQFQIKRIKPLQQGQRANSIAGSTSTNNTNKQQPIIKKEELTKNSKAPFILKANQFVFQKYIEKPLLINNRKFDIRVWALVSHTLDVYFFREGYIRLSSSEFSTDESQLDNLFIHLTNNAIQKYSDTYGQFENGNMWSFGDLWTFLEQHYQNSNMPELENKTAKFYKKKIVSKIKDIIWLTFCSVKKKLNQHDRKHCFEMFGFDFLVDANLHTWLIEVNTNPAIEECSRITQTLVPRAIDDAFSLTIDQIFSKKVSSFNCNQPNNNNNGNNNNSNLATTSLPKTKSGETENDSKTVIHSQNETLEDTLGGGGKVVQDEVQEDQLPQDLGNRKLTGEVPPQDKKEEPKEVFPVQGYEDNYNMWEMLGNLKDSSNMLAKKKFKQLK